MGGFWYRSHQDMQDMNSSADSECNFPYKGRAKNFTTLSSRDGKRQRIFTTIHANAMGKQEAAPPVCMCVLLLLLLEKRIHVQGDGDDGTLFRTGKIV